MRLMCEAISAETASRASRLVRLSITMTLPIWICTRGLFLNANRGKRLLIGHTRSDPTIAVGNTTASAALAISKNPRRTLPKPLSKRFSGGTILPSSMTPTGRPLRSVSTAVSIVARQPLPALMHPEERRNQPTKGMSKYLSRTKIRGRSPTFSRSVNPTGKSKKLRWFATTTIGLPIVFSGSLSVCDVRQNNRLAVFKEIAQRENRRSPGSFIVFIVMF